MHRNKIISVKSIGLVGPSPSPPPKKKIRKRNKRNRNRKEKKRKRYILRGKIRTVMIEM